MTSAVWSIVRVIILGILVLATKLCDPIVENGFLFLNRIAEYVVYPLYVHQSVENLVDAIERLREIQAGLLDLDPYPPSERCKGWVQSVQDWCRMADNIKAGHDGCGLNYFNKCYFAKEADKELKKGNYLVHTGKKLLLETRARPRQQRPQRQLWGMNSYKQKVHDFVKNTSAQSRLLGIWGMGGVGKTTLLRFVRDRYAHGFAYFYVFFVGAGTGCTVARLQHVLSVNIGLGPPPQMPDVPIMAKIISKSLQGKTFVLLLDDVRERLDLAAVGLPMPLGNRQKVIFTTRNQATCVEMGCTSNTIKMECLGEYDAWNLFKDIVGDAIIEAHPQIENLAKKMAAECRGLPSTLCTLGRAMSTKGDVKECRYAYDMLKRKQPPVNEI